MQDQEDEGHHDQEVNEASGDMEHDITQEPGDYQHTKENQEHDFHSFVAKLDCRAARSYQPRGWTAGPGAAQSARELSLEDPPPDLGERRRMSHTSLKQKACRIGELRRLVDELGEGGSLHRAIRPLDNLSHHDSHGLGDHEPILTP
jgi:hypothetical protein